MSPLRGVVTSLRASSNRPAPASVISEYPAAVFPPIAALSIILTTAQMREIDKAAIGGNTAAGYSLMTEAGAGLFDEARRLVTTPRSGDIAVVCGGGNNGGDGFAAARLLLEAGYKVMCFGLCQPDDL